MPRVHRLWTLSFGPVVGSDLRADREPFLGFDTAGPEAQPYHSINSRKAKGRWYYWPKVAWMPRAVRRSGVMVPVTGRSFCVWYCSMASAQEVALPSMGPV